MENIDSNLEPWQVETGGNIFDTSLDEMKARIAEGSLLRIDRVRKGDLRWIEAGKVPTLLEFFNAKDAAEPSAPTITTSTTEILGVSAITNTFANAASQGSPQAHETCGLHPNVLAAFLCRTCSNLFCQACPGSDNTAKICPFCGSMCEAIERAAPLDAKDKPSPNSTTAAPSKTQTVWNRIRGSIKRLRKNA